MLGESLRYVKNRVEVYGHTDPVQAKNPTEETLSNWGLSLARALSVSEALRRAGYGYDIRVFGMADTRFFELASVETKEKKYALARRVDIVIREAKGLDR
ncbi:OmpA family protein [Sneathiella glossodoripedis]|uniref:OmpA family protein n=1 Tax=Sneathiella glossodoripedis TaxID=418853 RepID=UPI00046F7EDD|nr:OmpA family protein [Sneathiella glossodoripedis]